MTDQQIEQLLAEAYAVATESPDPSSQNGAIIVSPGGQILTRGCNTFPHGVEITDDRLNDRDIKYKYIEHAERNAIYAHTCDHSFMSTEGLFMVCPWAACPDCARAIIQTRIKRVITHKARMDLTATRWTGEIARAIIMFEEAGIQFIQYTKTVLFCEYILVDSKPWNPGNVS